MKFILIFLFTVYLFKNYYATVVSVDYVTDIVVTTFIPSTVFNIAHPILGICLDLNQINIYITETGLNTFRKIVIATGDISTVNYTRKFL